MNQIISQNRNIDVCDLGLIKYIVCLSRQKEAVLKVISSGSEQLILCEHEPIITKGRMARDEHVFDSQVLLNEKGIDINLADRGGDVTLHAPGQMVVYPILNLANRKKDLKLYLNSLEAVVIDFLKKFDILARRENGQTGIWIGSKKIASIGIGVKKWVTYHGIGINISTDLSLFKSIKPCGLDVEMTSLSEALNRNISINDVKETFVESFKAEFEGWIL